MVRKLKRILLFAALGPAGCTAPLPPETTQVLALASQRVELNASADRAALNNLVDNADFSRADVEEALALLERIDAGALPDDDRAALEDATRTLERAREGLAVSEPVRARAERTARAAGEVVRALEIVRLILAEKIGQEEVLHSIADALNEQIGGGQ